MSSNSIHHCNEYDKMLKNYLPKETKDLYIENYETLKKTERTQIDVEIYPVHGVEESI